MATNAVYCTKNWDETEKKNKNRCYCCGDRGHQARWCERPGGGEEGLDLLTEEQRFSAFSMFRSLPQRPNGEEVSLLAPKENLEEMLKRNRMDDQRLRHQRHYRHLKELILRAQREGEVVEDLVRGLETMVTEDYFEGRDEIPEFVAEVRVKDRIAKTRKEIEELARTGLVERTQRRTSQSPLRPRINMVKVIKVELEEEDEDFSKHWKSFLVLMGAQLIMSWLYAQCQRRRSKAKPKVEVEDHTEELSTHSDDE